MKSLYLFIFIFLVGLAVSLFFGIQWLQKPTTFPITRIQIQGKLSHQSPLQIREVIQSALKGGFFSLNLLPIKENILTLPWIRHVSFRREWPDTLLIRIQEKTAVARFGKKGLIDDQGNLFYPALLPSDSLPTFECEASDVKTVLQFYQSISLLIKLLNLSIETIKEDDANNFEIALSNNMRVKVGKHHRFERFSRMISVYPKIIALSSRPIESMDMRYQSGVAVKYARPL